jgi:mannose-6-phosphate isomerase-like protein (cupin superfamily)
MKAIDLEEARMALAASGESYHQFLNEGSLSLGLYALPAGSDDPQDPHAEDEVYFVVTGRALVHVDGEDRAVSPGSMIFVGEGVDHRFHEIAEDLLLLVVFAPEHQPSSR